jgi:hypothetical protein
MRLEARNYYSSDIDDVRNWEPDSPEDVCFQLSFDIGEKGDKASYTFQVVVATPEGLRRTASTIEGYEIPDRALLVFSDYSWHALQCRIEFIATICGARAETWQEAVPRLTRYFIWEYEDY